MSLREEDRNFSVNDSKLIASSVLGSSGFFLNDIRFSIPIHMNHNSSWTIRLSNTLDDVRRMDEKKKEEEKEESPPFLYTVRLLLKFGGNLTHPIDEQDD